MSKIAKTIGFLGCGSMAECIMAGILKSGAVTPDKIFVCNRTPATMERLKETYNVNTATASELAKACDIVILGVKPYGVTAMLDVIRNDMAPSTLLVSVAAGVKLEVMARHLNEGAKIVRAMPNIPSFVGCGMTSITPNARVTTDETELVVRLFECVGKASIVDEGAIHGVIGVAGSSPAYVFMFIEALSDGAVQGGLPRSQAYELAAQAVIGAARMVQETGKTPGALKDMVCSPGGTTIEAVRYLEKGGMRSSVIEAMVQCMSKSRDMEAKYDD